MAGPLGRRIPKDTLHVEKYRLALPVAPTVERTLPLPPFRAIYDQGQEGACVGYGSSWAMSIQHAGPGRAFPRFDPEWLYQQAQLADDWPETPPEEGTSVRAAFDVLRLQGDRRIARRKEGPPDLAYGVKVNRWATSVDEVRAAIADGRPVTIGIDWMTNFDAPVKKGADWWIGVGELGRVRGGHCVCVYGASDRRQAVKIVNNWGKAWPLVYMPYDTLQAMLNEQGEAAVIVDA